MPDCCGAEKHQSEEHDVERRWVPVMPKAFDKTTGPLRDPSEPEPEREAIAHLFAGAIGHVKNPHSHRNGQITDPGEAVELLLLASHLLRIVDGRSKQP